MEVAAHPQGWQRSLLNGQTSSGPGAGSRSQETLTVTPGRPTVGNKQMTVCTIPQWGYVSKKDISTPACLCPAGLQGSLAPCLRPLWEAVSTHLYASSKQLWTFFVMEKPNQAQFLINFTFQAHSGKTKSIKCPCSPVRGTEPPSQ